MKKRILIAFALPVLMYTSGYAQYSHVAAYEFSADQNPGTDSGANWFYGYSASATEAGIPLPVKGRHGDVVHSWMRGQDDTQGVFQIKADLAPDMADWASPVKPALVMRPGAGREPYTTVCYKATEGGWYSIRTTWRPLNGKANNMAVSVTLKAPSNKNQLWSEVMNGSSGEKIYDKSTYLDAGDYLIFSVGNGQDGAENDAISVVIAVAKTGD